MKIKCECGTFKDVNLKICENCGRERVKIKKERINTEIPLLPEISPTSIYSDGFKGPQTPIRMRLM